jgi:phosphomannomutase
MKTTFLFDLDGTLCESRKSVTNEIISLFKKVNKEVEIGILTGSDLDFLKEQCEKLFQNLGYENKVYALACNGTKAYTVSLDMDSRLSYKLMKEENLRNKIGEEKFKIVMSELVYQQAEAMIDYDFPLTGNFITYRGSTINWCPVGRCASDNDRSLFKIEDEKKKVREMHIENIRQSFFENNINLIVNIAGDTSFDIYPSGWDKTYAMQFFDGHDVYFWGDRTEKDGNDHTMKKLLNTKCFSVSGSEETFTSVKKLLGKISNG